MTPGKLIGALRLFALVALTLLLGKLVHRMTRDGGSLVQNAVTVSLTAVLAWLHSTRFRKTS